MRAADVVTHVPAELWSEVLASDPGATLYQTPAWARAVRRATGMTDVSRLYVLEDGRRILLPMVRAAPVPGLAVDASYPSGYGSGGLLASGGLRDSDVRLVLSDLLRSPALSTRIRANHDTAGRWDAGLVPGVTSTPRRVEVLDLDGGFAHVWSSRFQSSARRAVRKAEQSGLVVEKDTSGRLVPAFYDLYLRWTRRRAEESGLPTRLAEALARRRVPLRTFEAVAAECGESCRLWAAWHRGELAAAIITLVHGDHATYWHGYSHKTVAGPTRANNLLHRLAIEDAIDSGCRYYSMGESGGVAELIRFKQTLGATPRRAVEVRIERLPLTGLERLGHRGRAYAAGALSRLTQLGQTRNP
ncbi:GNAT family N-acetyltransferase [Georgenia daeguensis]|uniref:BioF2-like acetyltransferase domain-containing protein n=1 Tax=Georgenia daeguensis TaxID=908355 RepID=A0ABP8EX68_9MICO